MFNSKRDKAFQFPAVIFRRMSKEAVPDCHNGANGEVAERLCSEEKHLFLLKKMAGLLFNEIWKTRWGRFCCDWLTLSSFLHVIILNIHRKMIKTVSCKANYERIKKYQLFLFFSNFQLTRLHKFRTFECFILTFSFHLLIFNPRRQKEFK